MATDRLALLKRHASKVIASLLFGGVFVWILHRGGLPIVPDRAALAHVAWWAAPAYAGFLACQFLLRSYRWTHLVSPLADVPTRRVMGVGLIGISAILFAPLRMGELVRPWMLAARSPVSFAQAAGTVGAERVIDGLVLSIVLLGGLIASTPISPMPPHVVLVRFSAWAALALFTCAFLAMAAFYSFRDLARRVTHRVVSLVSQRAAQWVTTQVERVADGLRFLPSSRHAAPYLRDTVVYWLANVLGMWTLLRGCGVDASFAEACVTMGVLGVGIMLPAGPGFFGAFQASVYAALAMFFPHNVVTEEGAAYVFVLYAMQLVFSLCSIPLGYWLARPDHHAENLAHAPPLRHSLRRCCELRSYAVRWSPRSSARGQRSRSPCPRPPKRRSTRPIRSSRRSIRRFGSCASISG